MPPWVIMPPASKIPDCPNYKKHGNRKKFIDGSDRFFTTTDLNRYLENPKLAWKMYKDFMLKKKEKPVLVLKKKKLVLDRTKIDEESEEYRLYIKSQVTLPD